MMPIDLVLVRHGESEGNVASKRSRQGDDRDFTPEFRARHNSKWRLTDKGIWQANHAGLWLYENIGSNFDRYYVSEYVRAMETAAYLQLPEAAWRPEFYLRERDWGDFDVMSHAERQARYAEALARRDADSFFWTPPNGESMAQLCLRIERIFNTLHRQCSQMKVVIVCHGEVMWAFRVRLERMRQYRFQELDASRHPHDNIHNCQILHYTRRNPESGEEGPYLGWFRSVCPYDASLSNNNWQAIERRHYSSAQLLREVTRILRLVNE